MSDLWDSLQANGEVVTPLQPRTSIYENPDGAIVIRQRSADFDDDSDPFVVIRPELVPVVVRAMLMEVGLEGLLVREYPAGPYLADPRAGQPFHDADEISASSATPTSGAERQRRYRERRALRNVTRDVTRDAVTDDDRLPFQQAAE